MATNKYPANDLVASNAEADTAVQIREIFDKLGGKTYEWLLITKQHIFPCEAQIHPTREALIGDLGNALTCNCDVVAIYHQARDLPEGEIQPMLKEAMDELGPISKARAEGRL